MIIKGIESISDYKVAKAILGFVYDEFDNEDIKIEYVDDYKYLINDSEFLIIRDYEEQNIVNTFNTDLFNDKLVQDITNWEFWEEFIDEIAWIDKHGISDFEEYWKKTMNEELSYIGNYDSVNFYSVK